MNNVFKRGAKAESKVIIITRKDSIFEIVLNGLAILKDLRDYKLTDLLLIILGI